MSFAKTMKTILVSLLMSATAQASYPYTARHLTWDEAGTLKQCKVQACKADDQGDQYIKICSQFVNEDGTTTWVMMVMFSEMFGRDCYCPCVNYFIDEVKRASHE
jgi:hypothetical protein